MADLAPITIEGAPTAPSPEPAPSGLPPGVSDKAIPTEDPGHVALVGSDGEVKSIPIQNAGTAVKQYGYRPATDVEYYAAKTGTAGVIMSGVAGVGRGLSFGAFDPLAIEAERAIHGDQGADEMRDMLRLLREANPTASTVGEIAGSLAPLAFGVPPAAAGARLGESAIARAATRAVQAAPRLAAEGTAFGVGHQLTEDTLGNHELVAGKYLAAGLEGGLLNLFIGAGLAAGGGAIADRLATRGAKAATAAEAAGKPAGKGMLSKIEGLAEEQAAKGAMPASSLNAAEMQKLGRTAEEQVARVRRIGRTLLDEGITTAGASKAVQAERLTKRVAEVGQELGVVRKSLEASAVRPSATNVMQAIESEVLTPLRARPFSQAEQASVTPFVEEITERIGGKSEFSSFDDLFKLRSALDKKLDPKLWQKLPGTAPAGYEELGQIRGILESEFERAAEAAAVDLGEEVATKYRTTKALFSDLKTAEKWATKGAAREAQNRAFSLTDTIAAAAGLSTGSPLGILAPVGNKLVRTYGNQAAAVVLDRAAKLETIQRAAAAFDTRLQGSVKAFFGGGPPPQTSGSPYRTVAPKDRQALRAAVTNPAALTEHIADYVARTGLREAAPNVTGALSQSMMRAATLVQQKLPREPSPVGVSFGQREPRALGPRAQAEMERALSALDVDKTLDDLAHRRISREQIEAIKFVNPPLFVAMQKAVRDYGMANDPDVSIQQEMALAIMFDTPVSTYTRGATIRGFQQAFAQGATSEDPTQAGGPQPTPIGSGESKAARSLASPTDRLEASDAL